MESTVICLLAVLKKDNDKQMETKRGIDVKKKPGWGIFLVFQKKTYWLLFSPVELSIYAKWRKLEINIILLLMIEKLFIDLSHKEMKSFTHLVNSVLMEHCSVFDESLPRGRIWEGTHGLFR